MSKFRSRPPRIELGAFEKARPNAMLGPVFALARGSGFNVFDETDPHQSSVLEERTTDIRDTESARLALLDRAVKGPPAAQDSFDRFEAAIRADTAALLGGPKVIGRAIESESDLLAALIQGLPSGVLVALREAGLPHSVFEQVIAPRRTLMRRKAEAQRLTRGESDAAWRLARLLALASHVLDGRAAIDWLLRAKPAFDNRTPIDLAETSVGTGHVERLLRNLEWGDVA